MTSLSVFKQELLPRAISKENVVCSYLFTHSIQRSSHKAILQLLCTFMTFFHTNTDFKERKLIGYQPSPVALPFTAGYLKLGTGLQYTMQLPGNVSLRLIDLACSKSTAASCYYVLSEWKRNEYIFIHHFKVIWMDYNLHTELLTRTVSISKYDFNILQLVTNYLLEYKGGLENKNQIISFKCLILTHKKIKLSQPDAPNKPDQF